MNREYINPVSEAYDMQVDVALFGQFKEPVGERTVTLDLPEDAILADAVDELVARYPALEQRLLEDDELTRSAIATCNDRSVNQLGGLDTELSEGDVVQFAPPVEGG